MKKPAGLRRRVVAGSTLFDPGTDCRSKSHYPCRSWLGGLSWSASAMRDVRGLVP